MCGVWGKCGVSVGVADQLLLTDYDKGININMIRIDK